MLTETARALIYSAREKTVAPPAEARTCHNSVEKRKSFS